MKNKVIKMYLILLSILLLIFLPIYIKDGMTILNENSLKEELPSTDLSTVTVDTHKLGENITKIDKRIFLLYCENGETLSGYDQDEDFSGCVAKRIVAFMDHAGAEIGYRGRALTNLDEVKNELGKNYIEGIPINGQTDIFTYIDHKNNIELSFANSGYIVMKRIGDFTGRFAATPIISFFFNPGFLVWSLIYNIKSAYLLNPIDYFLLPPYFALLILPFILLFIFKDKKAWKKMLIVVITITVISGLTLLFFVWNMMMGV